MERFTAFFLALMSATSAWSQSATGDVFCDERALLIEKLERSYGAIRMGSGMRGPDAVMEIWAVPTTGDWTMVQSYTNGQSCVVAMGENWEFTKPNADPA